MGEILAWHRGQVIRSRYMSKRRHRNRIGQAKKMSAPAVMMHIANDPPIHPEFFIHSAPIPPRMATEKARGYPKSNLNPIRQCRLATASISARVVVSGCWGSGSVKISLAHLGQC